jgi:hypothetical protein
MLMATSPLAMLALTDDPVQLLLTAHAFVGRTYSFKEEYLSKGREYKHDKLRIGYVSGDLCTHAVGLLLDKVFDLHDRSKVDLYAYDFSPEDGTAVRAHLKNSFYKLHSIHQLTDRQVAELILTDEIDVLIDLHGLKLTLTAVGKRGMINEKNVMYFDIFNPNKLSYFTPLVLDDLNDIVESFEGYVNEKFYVEFDHDVNKGVFFNDELLKEIKQVFDDLPFIYFQVQNFLHRKYWIEDEIFISQVSSYKSSH